MALEDIEVSITVKQLMAADDATPCQNHVQDPVHDDAQAARLPVVPGSLDGDIGTAKNDQVQPPEKSAYLFELLVESTTLKHQSATRSFRNAPVRLNARVSAVQVA